MKTITINAFGYEHSFTDGWNSEEAEMIENAPYVYLLNADAEMVGSIENELPEASMLFWSDAGEALVFSCEELSDETLSLLQYVVGIVVDGEERSEQELAA